MPRPSNTATRRTQIVRAMSVVMAGQGYDGATIQAVAAQAGLTPGLVHYHFKSKLEILLSLIEHIEENVLLRYEALKKKKDPAKDLKAFIDAFLSLGDGADQVSVRCWIIIGAEALRQRDVDAAYKAVVARQIDDLEKIVKRCLKDEAKSTRASRSIALGIHASIEGSLRLLVSAPSMIEVGFAAPTVFAMAKGAIAGQPKA
jgi:TetR/AcrR family transcriptional regulator, transcriptional repressor of bet genes